MHRKNSTDKPADVLFEEHTEQFVKDMLVATMTGKGTEYYIGVGMVLGTPSLCVGHDGAIRAFGTFPDGNRQRVYGYLG